MYSIYVQENGKVTFCYTDAMHNDQPNDWVKKDDALSKTFVFKNFVEALAFVNKVGDTAERVQHHPDITLEHYKEVVIRTSTHDAGNNITDKDYALAKEIDSLWPLKN